MFKALGILVLLYTLLSAASGKVHAKAGPLMRTVSRAESPVYFWTVIGIYAALGVALMTIF